MDDAELQRFAQVWGWSREELLRARLALLNAQMGRLRDHVLGLSSAKIEDGAADAEAIRKMMNLTPEQFAAGKNRTGA